MTTIYKISKYILTLLAFMLCTDVHAQVTTDRDVLAVPGASGNSYDWFSYINYLKYHELYKIRDMYSPEGYDLFGTIPQNVAKLNTMINVPPVNVSSYNNILAIGHDVGGLAVRGVEQINPKVTGMILVGTPNNGSNLLRDILAVTPNINSLEKWVDNLKKFRGNIQCPDCDKVGSLSSYITSIKNDKNYLSGAKTSPSAYYNTLPAPNPQKTAVIWGNAGKQNLSELFGNQGGPNPSSTIDLDKCARDLKAIAIAGIQTDKKILTIKRITGFLTTITSLITNISSIFLPVVGTGLDKIAGTKDDTKTYPNTGQVTNYIGTFINTLSQTIINDITSNTAIAEKERNLMICELTNQLMESEWRLRIAQGKGSFEGTINPAYDPVKCQAWSVDCQTENNVWAKQIACKNKKMYCHGGDYVFVVEPSDLVYTKSEQTIDGLPLTFEIQANHFREQAYFNNQTPMNKLFSGINGFEFLIQK